MEIYFNELSYADDEIFIDYVDMQRMSSLYKELNKNDIRICRIDGETYSRLIEDARKLPHGSSNAINFLYSFLRES